MPDFNISIQTVLLHEGTTFTETPGDLGGATRYGITIPTLNDFNGKYNTADDIRNLTAAAAQAVYLKQFWTPMLLQNLHDQRLATIMLDQAVLNGRSTFTKIVQAQVHTLADGIMGPQTIAACNATNTENLILDILSSQTLHYIDLVTQNTSQLKFLKGWESRLLSLYGIAFRVA